MIEDHFYYANHPMLWIASLIGIAGPLIMSIYMFTKARATAKKLGMENDRISKGLKVAGINALGPDMLPLK